MPPLADRLFAWTSLNQLRASFGLNDTKTLPRALDALAKMGLAVTAPSVPPQMSEACGAICESLESALRTITADYHEAAQALLHRQFETLGQRGITKFTRSRFCRNALSVAGVYALTGWINFSLAAHIGIWLFRRSVSASLDWAGLPKGLPAQKRRAVAKARALLQESHAQLAETRRLWDGQKNWFRVAEPLARWHGESNKQIDIWQGDLSNATEEARRACRRRINQIAAQYQRRSIRKARDWWLGTRRDRAGRWWRGDTRQSAVLVIASTLIPFLLMGTLCAMAGWWPLVGLAILGWPTAFFLGVTYLHHCAVMSRFLRQRVAFLCPECRRKLWLWCSDTQARAKCPACGALFVPGSRTSDAGQADPTSPSQ
jgi:hypothetical protein